MENTKDKMNQAMSDAFVNRQAFSAIERLTSPVVAEQKKSYTKGPWYLLQTDGADFTAISTKDKLPLSDYRQNEDGSFKEEHYDSDNEVLGSSEWLRASEEDLTLMAASPELYEALKKAQKLIQMFLPNVSQCFNIDFQLLNETGIEVSSILSKLKEIE